MPIGIFRLEGTAKKKADAQAYANDINESVNELIGDAEFNSKEFLRAVIEWAKKVDPEGTQQILEQQQLVKPAETKNPKKDYKTEYLALKAELIPQITAPSTYPIDAVLPDIVYVIENLRKLEPEIVNMGVNKIFGSAGPYLLSQKIQGYYNKRNLLDNPVRIWAAGVAGKFIL
jgi:hypothetical protein